MGYRRTGKAYVMSVLLAQVLVLEACHAHMSSQAFDRIETGAFGGTGQKGCRGEVLRDPVRLEKFYRELRRNRLPARPIPAVDFNRNVILFFSMGTRPTSGFSVDVQQVFRKGDKLEVMLMIMEPSGIRFGPRC